MNPVCASNLRRVLKFARAAFKHGAETLVALPGSPDTTIIASYHPSQQNTNTGVLTEAMLDAIFTRSRELVQAR